jgi:hypothetical protein
MFLYKYSARRNLQQGADNIATSKKHFTAEAAQENQDARCKSLVFFAHFAALRDQLPFFRINGAAIPAQGP